jgi:uncharacterized protein
MPRVVHFEIGADDPDRALKFYERVFGWTAQTWDGPQSYWVLTTGPDSQPGINGGMMRRDALIPPTVNIIDVPDVDAYCERVQSSGGRVSHPKSGVTGVGWVAYCEDTEGNTFGIIQFDREAK